MSNEIVAKRYASALFQIALEQESLQAFEEDLKVVKQVFRSNPKLIAMLNHPKISVNEKKSLVQSGFASLLNPAVLNTLSLLVDRNRIDVINEMADEFTRLSNEKSGTEDGIVYSVRILSNEELNELSVAFAKKIGKKALRLENVIDQSLVGGVKIRMGNRIYDGSISGKLERIERTLVKRT
ncbi:F0F1 ATP synthase subunit delta [Metabacillus sp. RGM 3146]|uniref:F0F1 ATP synthase subunit delta n=1 Tax=Metabacillus sp. RGM 3146 TaxID=3401092 RepID=UPI003B995319